LLQDIELGTCLFSDWLPPRVVRSLKLRPLPAGMRRLRNANPAELKTIWPHLEVISCWGDGHAKLAKAGLEHRFPSALIQSKGLLATEAVVTIPFSGAYPLAVRSHFFEFINEQGRVCLAPELKKNGIYEVVVTAGSGLWRYRLRDQVEVTGFVGKTPSLCFRGRAGNVSDRFGEKLSEHFVARAIQEACGAALPLRFAMLAPDEDDSGCRYTLYIQGEVQNGLAACLDTLLRQNPHYAWCRKSGQLQPLRLFRIKAAGYETFVAFEILRGKRLGEIKPCSLSKETNWFQHLQGDFF